MDIAFWIGIALISLLLLILIISYVTFRMVFLSVREKHPKLYDGLKGNLDEKKARCLHLVDTFAKIEYKEVTARSRDGLTLFAKYYHCSDSAPLEIQFHGYKSMGERDFAGIAADSIRRGHNVLLVSQRAHGRSEGKVISFGIFEKYDVLSWVEYAIEKFGKDVKILLCGLSMGAATVLMSASLGLPKNVVGIHADCPYSSAEKIIKKVCRDMKIPPTLAFPFIRLGGYLFGGFDIRDGDVYDAVRNTDIPILLVHGDGDRFVPVEMSDEIHSLGKTVTYLKVKDATHGLSYVYDYDAYTTALNTFLARIL